MRKETIINTVDWRAQISDPDSRRYVLLELLETVELYTEDTESNKQGMQELFIRSDFGADLLFEMCKAGCNKKVKLYYYSDESRREAGENIVTEIKQEPAERLMFDKGGRWLAVLSTRMNSMRIAIWELK